MTEPAPPPPKPAPRGIRRVLRWVRHVGVVAVSAALLLFGAAIAVLETDFGRNLLRERLETVLRGQFPGGAKIGRIEGSLFGKLTAFDVELDGRDGKPMVKIAAVTVDAALRPLVGKRVRIDALVIDGLEVDIHPQPPAPPEPPAPPAPPGEPSAWTIELPRVELHDARVVYTDAAGAPLRLDGLELAAAVSVPAPESGALVAPPIVAALWARGTWREHGAASIAVSATYDRAREQFAVPLVAATFGEAAVVGMGLRGELGAMPSAAGALAGHAPRAVLAALGVPVDRALPGADAVDAVVDVAPLVPAGLPGGKLLGGSLVQLAVWAVAGPARVHGFFAADLAGRRGNGMLLADDADLSLVTGDAVRGHAHVIAALEGSAAGARGVLTVTGAVDVAPPTQVMIAVDATRERVILTAGAAGVDDARVAVLAEIQRAKTGGYTLARGRVSVRSRDPARATQQRVPLHGSVWLDARARGPLWPEPRLAVEADAGGTGLVSAALGVDSAKLHVAAYGVPLRTDAYAHLDITHPHQGAAGIADASLDLHALALPGEPVRVDLTKHQVRTLAGIVFAGGGGRFVLAPERIDVRNLSTGVGASKILASGSFAPRSGDLSAQLAITDLGLTTVAPDVTGTAGGKLVIARRGGRWSGSGDLAARALVARPGAPPVDADVHLDIAGTHVTAHGTASNAQIFTASLDVDLDAPRDLPDVAAWTRLPRHALHHVALGIERLDVDAAATAAGVDVGTLPVHGGGVTGELVLGEAGASGHLDLADAVGRSGRIDATLALAPGAADEIAATLAATAADVGHAELAARVVPPAHVFDAAEWRALDRAALRGATLTLPEQPFDPALLARFGVASPFRGRASITLATTAGAMTTTLAAAVHALEGGPLVQPIALDIGATLDGNGAAVEVTATAPQTPLLAAHARAPITLDRVLAVGLDAARFAPLTGDVAIARLQLGPALAIVDRRDITGGELAGAIAFGGTLGTPTATGSLAATAVTVAPGLSGKPLPRLDDLTLDVRWGGVSGNVDATAHESNGGTLTLHAQGGLAAPAAATVDLTAHALDLAPLAAFAPDPLSAAAGTLEADLHLRGFDPDTGKLTGQLRLTKGRMPLSPKVGTLRQLEATVKVDGASLGITADGLIGAGSVHVGGTVRLDGSTPRDADVTAVLKKFSPIGGVQPVIDATIDAKLVHGGGKWTGKAKVSKAVVNIPTTSSSHKLLPTGEPSDMEFVDAPPPPPKAIHLDAPADPWLVVSVDVAPTEVDADEVRAVVKASDLTVSYGDELGLDGYVDLDRGDVELFGRRYQVELALLTFDGGTDPELNVSISYAFPDVTTYTDVSGRLSEPAVNLRADPALYTQGQLLGFLLGGDPGGDPSSQARDQAATVGASVASAYLSQKLNKVLPVKLAVRCNPSTSSASAVCTAGKWVNPKLYVGYQQHLSPLPDENTGELDLEYYVLSHVVVDISGGDRNDGIDLLWRKRW